MTQKVEKSDLLPRIDRRELLVGGAAVGIMTMGLTDI